MSTYATSHVAPASTLRAGLASLRLRDIATGLGPGALIVYFSFRAGGFFPGTVAMATMVVLAALVLQLAVRGSPVAGLSLRFVLAAGALVLLAVWTLASSAWSHAPARALVEYDRVLLYTAGFVLFGLIGRTAGNLRWLLRGIVLATVAVCACSLATRLTPDVWSITTPQSVRRLAYPLTYWNALGLMAAMGFVLSLGLTCDDRETRTGRVLAAAGLPILAATLLLTLSRGAIAASVVGLAALVVVARPRALLSGLLAATPAVWLTMHAAYAADLLSTGNPESAGAVTQGHHVARVVVACVLAAAAVRAALLAVDTRTARLTLPAGLTRRPVVWGAALGAVIAACALAAAVSLPARIGDQYAHFVAGGDSPDTKVDLRDRLATPDNNGRIVQWKVAAKGFEAHPLHGTGAGTYELQWDRLRPQTYQIVDAHSLYAEVLGELGIVGLLLVATAILLILGGFAALARGPDRVIGGALFAAGLMWALHAGIDWDWEMPAVTFWLFAAGGLALGRTHADPPRDRATSATGQACRVALGAGACVLMLVPISLYRSEAALRSGVDAFAQGDCPLAIAYAGESSAALGIRPEAHALIGYCEMRLHDPRLAARAMQSALRNDPGNWELHYGLGLAHAARGTDPRPQLRIARRLNPREELTAATLALMQTGDASKWRRRALRAGLPTR